VAASVPGWTALEPAEQGKLWADTDHLLTTKRWEAARGFALADRMCVVIAANAALLVLGLHVDALRGVRTIIVHPSAVWRDGPRPGPVPGVVVDGPALLAGEAAAGEGPVLLAWDEVAFAVRHPERGRNVVHHELAHKLDLLDGTIDGMPPLASDDARHRWQAACEAGLEQVRRGELLGVVDDYAATNPAEFFAVVTELFFARPDRLWAALPDVYAVLRTFYGQDPAASRSTGGPRPH
jgi:Mlc titration factor MtfA (ptsG expression regulator)